VATKETPHLLEIQQTCEPLARAPCFDRFQVVTQKEISF